MIWLWVGLAVLLDGAAALLCGVVPDRALERYRAPMLGFAVGTLTAAALGDLLPEAVGHSGPIAIGWAIGAMVAASAIEWASARRGHHHDRPLVPAALLGSDALHNTTDGIAIAAAFLIGPRLGLVTAAAVILHELPEELADYALLRGAGMGKRTALTALALVQLTAGIGAAGALLASSYMRRTEGVLLAISCGMFLYIVVGMLPELWRARSVRVGLVTAVGAAIVVLLS